MVTRTIKPLILVEKYPKDVSDIHVPIDTSSCTWSLSDERGAS